ncbi:MAG TPA: VWA domain-containing protein [Candidatus Gracilibacteria bacterium]
MISLTSFWFPEMTLAQPYFFQVGILLVLVYGLKLWRDRRHMPTLFFSAFSEAKKAQTFGFGKMKRGLETFLVVVLIFLFAFVLARPQKTIIGHSQTRQGIDIYLALDVSESMLAEDLKPNRIEAAKAYIGDFVKALSGDQAGIIVFAGKPFIQVPLTFDYLVLAQYLSEVSVKTLDQRTQGLGGTAVGDVLLEAKKRFKAENDRAKVLVLVTDGDSNIGLKPLIGADIARAENIKVYTIGIGKKEGAPIPIGIHNGSKIYAQNPDGTLFKTKLDESVLKEIARISGGQYFYAENNETLKASFEAIQKLEKGDFLVGESVTYEDLFWGPLCLLIFMSFIYFSLMAFPNY